MYKLLNELKITSTKPDEIIKELAGKLNEYSVSIDSLGDESQIDEIVRKSSKIINAAENLSWASQLPLLPEIQLEMDNINKKAEGKKAYFMQAKAEREARERAIREQEERAQSAKRAIEKEVYGKNKFKISGKTVILVILSMLSMAGLIVMINLLPTFRLSSTKESFSVHEMMLNSGLWNTTEVLMVIDNLVAAVLLIIGLLIVLPISASTVKGKNALRKILTASSVILLICVMGFGVMIGANRSYDPAKKPKKLVSFSYGAPVESDSESIEQELVKYEQEMIDQMSMDEYKELYKSVHEMKKEMQKEYNKNFSVTLPDPKIDINWLYGAMIAAVMVIIMVLVYFSKKNMISDRKNYCDQVIMSGGNVK